MPEGLDAPSKLTLRRETAAAGFESTAAHRDLQKNHTRSDPALFAPPIKLDG